ncbi:hypothetical protein KI387_001431 [Taxus chinensis]|uniref:TF-B3 domain-containing protein n=1 Tax=Taxus chinensis TaxID=29808 RepID=A0AA38GW50_TAXCH|nr:hypothetical protein KI387_001431 [Taxus chinensis]
MGERGNKQPCWMNSSHHFDPLWSLQQSPLVWNNGLSFTEGRLFHSFPKYNALSRSRSASGSQQLLLPSNVPHSALPLSSASAGDLSSLQIKDGEGENAVTNCFPNKLPLSTALESAASVRANRKRRMARHRRVGSNSMPMDTNMNQNLIYQSHSSPCLETSQSHKARGRGRGYHDSNIELQEKDQEQELKEKDLKFLLQKELRNSDVGSLGRMVLPKKEAEAHLPTLTAREGMLISMEDMDASRSWNFKYRFWPNNKSRMYILENTGEFVKSHALRRGDFVMLYKDTVRGKYVIRGKRCSRSQETCNIGERNRICSSSNALEDGSVQSDIEVSSNVSNVAETAVEGAYMGSTMEDIFSKDFSIDFATGIPNSPKLESIPSFGSDEMSIEDFLNN